MCKSTKKEKKTLKFCVNMILYVHKNYGLLMLIRRRHYIMKKLFSIILCCALLSPGYIKAFHVAKSEQPKSDIIPEYRETIVFSNTKVELTRKIKDDILIVKGEAYDGACSIFTYDLLSGEIRLDGRLIDVDTKKTRNQLRTMAFYSDDYPAVYVTSYRHSFSDVVKGIAAITTLIGGVIAVANLTGLSLPSISTAISNWAGAIGLGDLAAGSFISGEIKYDFYRTKEPVMFPPAKRPLIAYRYQNTSVDFSIAGYHFHHDYNEIGDWYYAEKPF